MKEKKNLASKKDLKNMKNKIMKEDRKEDNKIFQKKKKSKKR